MTKELSGKTAFVTGSGRGLGRTMAERLAELGADVAIHDISWTAPAKYGEAADLDEVATRIARHGGKVCAVSGNIGDRDAVAAMKRTIDEKLGPVHILVNCAGGDIGAAGGKPNPNNALDISLEDIRTLTENNLIGTMLVCQAFIPPMKAAGARPWTTASIWMREESAAWRTASTSKASVTAASAAGFAAAIVA